MVLKALQKYAFLALYFEVSTAHLENERKICYNILKYVLTYFVGGNALSDFNIGQRLKSIRQSRKMTLEDVATLTGVSKPMLGQIEREQSTPTITTLWKIATGLKTPLSSFLEEQQPEYSVVNLRNEEIISEDCGRMRAYPLFVYDPIRNVEIFYIDLILGAVMRRIDTTTA